MNYKTISERTVRRARVAFLLAVAEKALERLGTVAGTELARQALDDAWRWVAGDDVRGSTIYGRVIQEETEPQGDRLVYHEQEATGEEQALWDVLLGALIYASRYAYDQERIDPRDMPQVVSEVDEDYIGETIDYALKGAAVTRTWLDHLADSLLAQYSTPDPQQLGPRIHRDEILAHEASR